jgi:hypothetical protein
MLGLRGRLGTARGSACIVRFIPACPLEHEAAQRNTLPKDSVAMRTSLQGVLACFLEDLQGLAAVRAFVLVDRHSWVTLLGIYVMHKKTSIFVSITLSSV